MGSHVVDTSVARRAPSSSIQSAGRRLGEQQHLVTEMLDLGRSRRELDDRIRLTQTIFEREELFRQLAETVDVVFWATNADLTRLEYIGPAFRQIAGSEVRLAGATPSLMLEIFAGDDRRTLVEGGN